jgi:tRNA(Met) C34 N-acetyltransferase TmcA
LDRLPIALSFTQGATLLGIGLQNKTIDDLEKDLKLEGRQLLANFNKVVVRITKFLRSLREEQAEKTLARRQTISGQTVAVHILKRTTSTLYEHSLPSECS